MNYDNLLKHYIEYTTSYKSVGIQAWEDKGTIIIVEYWDGESEFKREVIISLFELLTFVYNKIPSDEVKAKIN